MMRTIRTEKARPNWRDPKDYNSLNTLNLDQWAWEFLKKNQKYIELWDKFSNDLTEEQKLVQD